MNSSEEKPRIEEDLDRPTLPQIWEHVAYGSLAFFQAILHNIFILYHVETFVSIYKIDKWGFWLGESVFLVWNSVNDPFFGWLSDRVQLAGDVSYRSPVKTVRSRLQALQWNGPLLGFAFMLTWFQWWSASVQFLICLCLYDGFLTMVDLHYTALLADLALDLPARAKLNIYSSVGSAVGSISVFIAFYCWNTDNLLSFRLMCLCCFMVSMSGFVLSTSYLITRLNSPGSMFENLHRHQTIQVPSKSLKSKDYMLLLKFTKDLFTHRNFLWFSVMHIIQVFHCHFNSNFFPLFIHTLLPDFSPSVASLLMGLSFIMPHINNIYSLTLCEKYGTYNIVRILFLIKFLLPLVMYCIGYSVSWILALYLVCNRIFTEGTCKLLNLIICDIVDEDCVLRNRIQPVSALIFGSAAFVAKPGQTLAPVIGFMLLSIQSGRDIFTQNDITGAPRFDLSVLDDNSRNQFREACFHLVILMPVVCAMIQLLVWTRFTLKGVWLQQVKQLRVMEIINDIV